LTLKSVVAERYVRWTETLFKYGYVVEPHPRVPTSTQAGAVGVRGVRRADLGVPRVVIDIAELWTEGADPDRLALEQHGCHLQHSGWHAQLEPGDSGAERLDVDRAKPAHLTIHRHPLGSANDHREAAFDLDAPEAWVAHVEQLSADLSLRTD